MTVLIVEDNAGIRRLLRRTLLDTAGTIWECSDGSEALAAYETHRPDVVLMDVRMPRVDGLTATRQIRDYDPLARIVVVTDYEDEDIRSAAFEAGAPRLCTQAGDSRSSGDCFFVGECERSIKNRHPCGSTRIRV
jgi:CheY-like chemotaxis protein